MKRSPFYFVAILAILFGVYYLSRDGITSYHQEFIGTPFSDLPERVQMLLAGLIKVVGILFLSLGVALLAYVGRLSRPSNWRQVLWLLSFTLPPLLMLLYFTLRVGGRAPIWAPILAVALILLGTWSVLRDHKTR